MKYYAHVEETLKNAAHLLKATPENLADKITHMMLRTNLSTAR